MIIIKIEEYKKIYTEMLADFSSAKQLAACPDIASFLPDLSEDIYDIQFLLDLFALHLKREKHNKSVLDDTESKLTEKLNQFKQVIQTAKTSAMVRGRVDK
jgi:hypothetical protein